MLRRTRYSTPVNPPPDAISEPAGRSIDNSHQVVANLQNEDGFCAPQVGRDPAQFVYAAPGTV